MTSIVKLIASAVITVIAFRIAETIVDTAVKKGTELLDARKAA